MQATHKTKKNSAVSKNKINTHTHNTHTHTGSAKIQKYLFNINICNNVKLYYFNHCV